MVKFQQEPEMLKWRGFLMVFDELLEGQNKLTEIMEKIHDTLKFSNRIIMMVNIVNIMTIIVVGMVLLK